MNIQTVFYGFLSFTCLNNLYLCSIINTHMKVNSEIKTTIKRFLKENRSAYYEIMSELQKTCPVDYKRLHAEGLMIGLH